MTERFPNYEDLKSAGTFEKSLHGLTQRGFPLAIKKQAQKKTGDRSRPKCLACSFIGKDQLLLVFLESFQMKYPYAAQTTTQRPAIRTPAKTTSSMNMSGLLETTCCLHEDCQRGSGSN